MVVIGVGGGVRGWLRGGCEIGCGLVVGPVRRGRRNEWVVWRGWYWWWYVGCGLSSGCWVVVPRCVYPSGPVGLKVVHWPVALLDGYPSERLCWWFVAVKGTLLGACPSGRVVLWLGWCEPRLGEVELGP